MALRWHPRVSMSKEELHRFLGGRLIARLSTIDGDGYPMVTPVWYLWDGKVMFFNLGRNRSPTRNLMRNPKCGVVVDFDDRPLVGLTENLAKGVSLVGNAELFDLGKSGKTRAVSRNGFDPSEIAGKISSRYATNQTKDSDQVSRMIRKASRTYHPLLRGELERVLVRMTPTRIRAWDFSKAPFKD